MAPETYPRFAEIAGLHPSLKSALQQMELVTMTEIQAKTWEAASSGRDVLGRARTGTGKTVSFLLPALQQLLTGTQRAPAHHVSVLVLAPTRELALQIGEQARLLLADLSSGKGGGGAGSITHQVMVGGTSKPKDVAALERRIPTVLIATPGRLCDHLQGTTVRGSLPFARAVAQTKILVLDETDRLLDMGFRREIENIISYLGPPQGRQTLLFSATIPPEVRSVMAETMRPDFVTVDCVHDHDASSHTNAQVQQSHVIIQDYNRLVMATVEILTSIIRRERGDLKMVVFFPTANLVAFYARLFNDELKVPVLELHSRKSQSFRTKTADTFRAADRAILLTSDVSARGVDYPGVTHVVQFGIADSRESYIHRLGRTGRAERAGEGLLVLTNIEQNFLRTLKGLDIPVNQEMQAVADGAPSSDLAAKMEPILASIKRGRNDSLVKSIHDAYRSVLGFYNGKLSKFGIHGTETLVDFVNSFAMQAGLSDIPELELKTIKKMGLTQAKGLNIVKVASSRATGIPQGQNRAPGKGQPGGKVEGGNANNGGGRGGPHQKRRNSSGPGRDGANRTKKAKPQGQRTNASSNNTNRNQN